MKKLLALVLTACLAATMILPAAASDAALETRLAGVTLATKKLLDIGDEYTEFTGHLTEDTTNLWNLSWQNEKSSIDVSVTEKGKVASYSLNFNENTYTTPSGELKRFPKLTKAQAHKLAQAFLSKVLDASLESCELQEGTNLLAIYDNGNYNFYGPIQLSGKTSPVYVSLCVNSAKKAVTSFYRSDGGADYHTYPASAKVSKEAANTTLYSAVKMQLHYVVSEKDDKHAILQYTPEMKADYVVDALTGALLERNPQIIYREVNATQDISKTNGGGLTDVELKTVNELKGCLSSKDLESAARAVSELSITSNFKLESSNYYVEKQNEESVIYANLNFAKESKSPDTYSMKNVMLNAKTGAFLSMSAYAPIDPNVHSRYDRTQSEKIARAFAAKYHPEELKLTALASSTLEEKDARYQSFSFVRQVNGIAFPGNEITVTVDTSDGTIGNYSVSWNKEMSFADAKNIKTEQEAKAAYAKAAGINLFYEYITPDAYGATPELKLVYGFEHENVWGVDPVTGKPLTQPEEQKLLYAYSDITGHFAQKQIETLAEYDIGYVGGVFQPNQKLTQKDALSLIVPACGFSLNPNSEDSEASEDTLYANAYSMGLLNSSERNPSAPMTRANLTKFLVDAAGYGEVAKLKDIYRIGYKDDKNIPKDLFGYVAIAKGLGIIQGDANGKFNPNNVATRAQLAIMLYNILNR